MLRSAKQLQAEEAAFHPGPQDKLAVRRWITSAQEKLRDAAVINASGWRPRSVQGHHAFALEAACEAIGADRKTFDKLDAIRELRNQKYDGIPRTDADLQEAKAAFQNFSDLAVAWLQAKHPSLFK